MASLVYEREIGDGDVRDDAYQRMDLNFTLEFRR